MKLRNGYDMRYSNVNKIVQQLNEELIEDKSILEIKEWFYEICSDRE